MVLWYIARMTHTSAAVASIPWRTLLVSSVLIAGGFAPSPQERPSVVRSLPLSPRKPIYGEWPRTRSRLIDRAGGPIGYLRLARMDDDARFLAALHDSMREFRHTRSLIIDVRGNSGGSRDALHAILPYLMPPGSSPIVYNLARPLIVNAEGARGLSDDAVRSLERRGLFEVDDPRWSAAEREAIDRARRSFTPARPIPDGRFAPWRCAVVSPPDAADPAARPSRDPHVEPSRPDPSCERERERQRDAFSTVASAAFHVDRPVFVLTDSVCFIATDVFLSAIRLIPRVTLVGLPSAGGSGASVRHDITDRDGEPSGFSLRLSSMASFQTDGTPLDGVGVAPDIHRPYLPGDLVFGEDSMLAFTLDLVDRNHAQTAQQRIRDRGDE
jgi:Peptidase family S41